MLRRVIAKSANPVLFAAVAVVVLAITAPTANAQFGPVFELSRTRAHLGKPGVAMDGDGNALIVWDAYVQAVWTHQEAWRSAAGHIKRGGGSIGGSGASLAVAADGYSVVVWKAVVETTTPRTYSIQARARSPRGVWSHQDLTPQSSWVSPPAIGVDRDGDALVAWERSKGYYQQYQKKNYRIEARSRSKTGVLGPIQMLSNIGHAHMPLVAVDADGDALVVWHVWDLATGMSNVQARARSKEGVLGPILYLSEAGQDARSHQLAIHANGNAVIVWNVFDGLYWRIQARSYSRTGVLGPIQTLTNTGKHAGDPQIAMDEDGDALIVWARLDQAGYMRIQARPRSHTGHLGPIQTLSNAGQSAESPQIAVDRDRNAKIVWSRHDRTGYARIQARPRSKAGVLGPIQTVSEAGKHAFSPRVAASANGDAVVVWRYEGKKSFGHIFGAATP